MSSIEERTGGVVPGAPGAGQRRDEQSSEPATHSRARRIRCAVHRYYDPATDQFVSVDPALAVTGTPYSYAAADPMNRTDPLGLCSIFGNCWSEAANDVGHLASSAADANIQLVGDIGHDAAAAGDWAWQNKGQIALVVGGAILVGGGLALTGGLGGLAIVTVDGLVSEGTVAGVLEATEVATHVPFVLLPGGGVRLRWSRRDRSWRPSDALANLTEDESVLRETQLSPAMRALVRSFTLVAFVCLTLVVIGVILVFTLETGVAKAALCTGLIGGGVAMGTMCLYLRQKAIRVGRARSVGQNPPLAG